MPKKNTDKMLLKGNLPVRICRKEGAESCVTAPSSLLVAPGAKGAFTETLPATLASGSPRVLTYYVELNNRNGRSAGLSNGAAVLAGQAPGPVGGLTAQVRKDGVVLRWSADAASSGSGTNEEIRLHRKLLTPQPETKPKTQQGVLAPPPELLERSLLVEPDAKPGRALDSNIRFGQMYEYRAQRVARVAGRGQSEGSAALELAGPLSAPVRVEALDLFPPEVPTDLAAVANAADSAANQPAGSSIDLSWQAVTDTDLAGYIVYRRENDAAWERVSPEPPLVTPAFHDPSVQPGHTYTYSVSAIDQSGHESARSTATEETVPNP
jgi:hypothetical protein